MKTSDILHKLKNVTKTINGWQAICPAHDDKNASLSIAKGNNGLTLVHCQAGCNVLDVCKAAGITLKDLQPDNANRSHVTSTKQQQAKLKPKKTHATLEAAAKAAKWGAEQTSKSKLTETRCDIYKDAQGNDMAAVLRFDYADGTLNSAGKPEKVYRPLHRVADGWQTGDPAGKWPLFNLPEIQATDETIYICEGEKPACAGSKIGLICTTTAHGAKSPSKTDFSPIAGRDIVILPDNDTAGREYAQEVAALTTKAGARSVKIVDLPGIPAKGDLIEYIAAHNDQTPEQIEASIVALYESADEWSKPEINATTPTNSNDIKSTLWEFSKEKLGATELHRKQASAVVEWLHGRGKFYFHEDHRDFASVMYFDSERKLLLPVQGDSFLAWLADALAMNRAERSFAFVVSAVETEGLSERSTGITPSAYWESKPAAFYLSNGPGSMVRITAGRVDLVDNGTNGILFPYGSTLELWTLTEPQDPFETCKLFSDMSATSSHGHELFKLFVCSLPSNQRTKPPLCVSGTVGSGKTKAITGIFDLYGMPQRISAIHKYGEQDFWVQNEAGGLSCFDNADTRTDWLADALAAAATGGSMEKRKLYKDTERVTLRPRSWIAITSASPSFAADAGLADRLLVVRLGRRQGDTAEGELTDEIKLNRDSGLSWICETLSNALTDTEPVPGGLNARHPDFAKLAVRIGRATGREAEAVAALKAAEADKSLFNIENDWIGAVLLDLLREEPFSGTASELLDALKVVDPGLDGKLSVQRLSKRISKLWAHLESVFGATKEKDGHTGKQHFYFNQPSQEEITV